MRDPKQQQSRETSEEFKYTRPTVSTCMFCNRPLGLNKPKGNRRWMSPLYYW